MDFTLDIICQIKRILAKFDAKSLKFSPNLNKNTINDFHDGQIYKSFSSTRQKSSCCIPLTFTLNTDGISLSKKSNMSIWPIILVINELPLSNRFCIENTIISGNLI